MRILEIIVSLTGQSTVQTRGFRGASCRDASRFPEEALGQRISESLAAEYYRSEPTENVNRQQTGA